jgi:hypothetical protein
MNDEKLDRFKTQLLSKNMSEKQYESIKKIILRELDTIYTINTSETYFEKANDEFLNLYRLAKLIHYQSRLSQSPTELRSSPPQSPTELRSSPPQSPVKSALKRSCSPSPKKSVRFEYKSLERKQTTDDLVQLYSEKFNVILREQYLDKIKSKYHTFVQDYIYLILFLDFLDDRESYFNLVQQYPKYAKNAQDSLEYIQHLRRKIDIVLQNYAKFQTLDLNPIRKWGNDFINTFQLPRTKSKERSSHLRTFFYSTIFKLLNLNTRRDDIEFNMLFQYLREIPYN